MSSRTDLPFLVVLVVLALATVCVAAVQLTTHIPLSPWEPSIAMESIRLNTGAPVYETAHATHLYGPLLTVLFAGVFQIFGLNFIAARIVMSIFAFALALFLSSILCRGRSRFWVVLAFLLFLGINFRTNLIVFSTQPDWAAVFLAVVAVCLWTIRKESLLFCAGSIALFIAAFLFKQTSAAFALIPIVYLSCWQRPLRLRVLVVSAIPTISVLVAIAVIRWLWPQMFAAMVTIPGAIKVYPARALTITVYLFVTFPIFLLGMWSMVRKRRPLEEIDRWLVSALFVIVPISIWTMCKSGSGYNSLLFGYLGMTAVFIRQLDPVLESLRSLSAGRGMLAAIGIVLTIFVSFFVQYEHDVALLNVRHGDDRYDAAVAVAHRTGAISPQDPTIAYRANRYVGRSLFFELDTHAVNGNWPAELPATLSQEMAHSEYVIRVQSYVPTPVFDRGLLRNNFHPLAIDELKGSAYTVWKRTP